LKLALVDHVFCILNNAENPNVTPILYLNQLSIEKMQHCGRLPGKPEVFNLHPLFNAVIGGRGTGKSTLVESLRVSLSRVSELSDLPIIKQGIDSFISDVTSAETVMNLILTRRNEKFKCVWKKGNPSKIYKLVGNEWIEDNGSPNERFGVSIYSQKQINALAGKPSSLLEIIDRSGFVNYSSWKSKFDEQLTKLFVCSHKIRDLKKEVSSEGTLKANLDDIISDIESFEGGKHGEIFSKYQSTEDIKSRLDAAANLDDLLAQLDVFENFCLTPLSLEHIADDNNISLDKNTMIAIHNDFEREVNVVINTIMAGKEKLQQLLADRERQISQTDWHSSNYTIASEFAGIAEDYKAKGENFDPNTYQEWLDNRDVLREQLDLIDDAKLKLNEFIALKKKIITKLFVMRRRLQRKRQSFIKNILGDNRYVKMTLQPFLDTDSLESKFREILGLSSDNFSSSIYQEGSNESLLSGVFKSSASIREKIEAVSKVKNAVTKMAEGISPEGFKVDARLVNLLTNKMEVQPDIFDRLDWWWPEDKLVVQYAKDPNKQNFENLEKGSAGQKAAAILAFLLSHGEDPIVVDQPEDDLDNALIYQLIVAEIHKNKKRRQIVMVTHNPNIVVNGDAEMVNVLQYNGGQIQVADHGSLCDLQIRNQICNIMEGGKEAFEKRYKRIVVN